MDDSFGEGGDGNYSDNLANLKLKLVKERHDRKETELAALDLMREVKERYDLVIGNLRSEKKNLNTEKEMVEKDLKEANIAREKITTEFADLTRKYNECKEKIDKARGRKSFCASDDVITSLREQISVTNTQMNTLMEENVTLKDDLKTARKQTISAEVQADLTKYQNLYETSARKIERLEKKQKEFDEEKEKLLKDSLEARRAVRQMTKELYKDKYEGQISTLSQQIESAYKDNDELRKNLKTNEEKLLKLETDVEQCRADYDGCKQKNETINQQLNQAKVESETFLQELGSLKEKLKMKEESYTMLISTTELLKGACTDIEKQADEWQSLYEVEVDEKEKVSREWELMLEKVAELEQEVKSMQAEFASVSSKSSQTIRMLESQLDTCEQRSNEDKEKIDKLTLELEDERENALRMEDEANRLCFNVQEKDVIMDLAKDQVQSLEAELYRIKEEAAQYLTRIGTLQSGNHKLTEALEDVMEKYEISKKRVSEILNDFEVKEQEFACERIKLQETLHQKSKLIDHMQNTNSTQKTKKHWLTSLNSPAKPSTPTTPFHANRLKLVEGELNREKAKNVNLMREVDDTKFELVKTKQKLVKKHQSELKELSRMENRIETPVQKVINSLESFRVDEISPDTKASRNASYLQATTSNPSAPAFYSVYDEDENSENSVSSTSTTDNNAENLASIKQNTSSQITLTQSKYKLATPDVKEFSFSDSVLAELDA